MYLMMMMRIYIYIYIQSAVTTEPSSLSHAMFNAHGPIFIIDKIWAKIGSCASTECDKKSNVLSDNLLAIKKLNRVPPCRLGHRICRLHPHAER